VIETGGALWIEMTIAALFTVGVVALSYEESLVAAGS
jgi:hypothetical protein